MAGSTTQLALPWCRSLLLLCALLTTLSAQTPEADIPRIQREFRGAWVATVANIDWPSKRTLSAGQQQAEMIRLLELAKELNLNAIVLQVRPQCDALYASRIEPWSEYLTGQMGKAPKPYYDPLKFAVAEAHKRGLELHAWFNPYRALHPSAARPAAPGHISVKRPDLAKPYGKYIWLDPGEKEIQDYSLRVIMDVVKRYDIDGVHFDDYFYPYKEKDAAGQNIPFPDEPSWQRYIAAGGKLSRADWRRQNVNDFIQRVSSNIKKAKPFVKFGISPFGIWQPGHPPGIAGFNAYEELYADSRKWLQAGWVDYLTPQLYWPIKQTPQSYTTLLDWWVSQNTMGRHIWPGDAVYRIGSGPAFPASEILDQIRATRQRVAAAGHIHFSMAAFLKDRESINGLLKSGVYAQPALVPATPWIDRIPPQAPSVTLKKRERSGNIEVRWKGRGAERAFLWVVYVKDGETCRSVILPGATRSYLIPKRNVVAHTISMIAVSAVDRLGNESPRRIIRP